jgi:hypothetical protein
MHTGKWWWATQVCIATTIDNLHLLIFNFQQAAKKHTKKTGITLIPIILSSDKTQLTVFGLKTAYSLYLTIGNLPKHIQRKPSHKPTFYLHIFPPPN